jgi:hypothetical protein
MDDMDLLVLNVPIETSYRAMSDSFPTLSGSFAPPADSCSQLDWKLHCLAF